MSKKEPLEMLFVSAQSSESYSIRLLDANIWQSRWSFRGNAELKDGTIGVTEILGRKSEHLLVSIAGKQVLCAVPLLKGRRNNNSDGLPPFVRSFMPGIIGCLAAHPSGAFLFASIGSKLHTWEISSGQLLSIVDDHFQDISVLKVSNCGHFVASASLDGAIKTFLTVDLVSALQHDIEKVKPVAAYSTQNPSAVRDLQFLSDRSPRILTVSSDHTVMIYSIAAKKVLLRVSTDRPLTACCADPAQTRVFLGSNNGQICSFQINSQFGNKLVSFAKTAKVATKHFEHHKAEISRLCVNFDGTRLASGDKDGAFSIWDTSNCQCLKGLTLKGPINALKFVENWLTSTEEPKPFPQLLRNLSSKPNFRAVIINLPADNQQEKVTSTKDLAKLNDFRRTFPQSHEIKIQKAKERKKRKLDETLEIFGDVPSAGGGSKGNASALSKRVDELESELTKVLKINAELYSFAANLILNEDLKE